MPPPSPAKKLTFAIVPQVGHEKRGSFYIRLDQLKPSDDERDDQGLSEDSTTYIHIYGRFVSPPSYLGLTTLHAASTFFCHHNPIPLPRIPLHSKPLPLSSSRLPLSSSRPLPQGQPPPRMHAARLQAPRRPFRRPASHRHGLQDGVRYVDAFPHSIFVTFGVRYDGHSQLQSGPLPAGNPGEFDVITCQDLDSGELQQFKLAYD